MEDKKNELKSKNRKKKKRLADKQCSPSTSSSTID
jgi:hypothetical protein